MICDIVKAVISTFLFLIAYLLSYSPVITLNIGVTDRFFIYTSNDHVINIITCLITIIQFIITFPVFRVFTNKSEFNKYIMNFKIKIINVSYHVFYFGVILFDAVLFLVCMVIQIIGWGYTLWILPKIYAQDNIHGSSSIDYNDSDETILIGKFGPKYFSRGLLILFIISIVTFLFVKSIKMIIKYRSQNTKDSEKSPLIKDSIIQV